MKKHSNKLEDIKRTIEAHKELLREKYKVREIGVFGSYVRGEQNKTSDIDIVVEFTEAVSLLDLVEAELYLSEILGTKVDLIPKEDIRPELKDRILEETVYI